VCIGARVGQPVTHMRLTNTIQRYNQFPMELEHLLLFQEAISLGYILEEKRSQLQFHADLKKT